MQSLAESGMRVKRRDLIYDVMSEPNSPRKKFQVPKKEHRPLMSRLIPICVAEFINLDIVILSLEPFIAKSQEI